MKIVSIIGARPQFIKAAVVSQELLKIKDIKEVLVHTGQHYDFNMSDIFFNELQIPEPDYNLGIGSGGHGLMTGRMLEKLEKLYLKIQPDLVLVYGDTNSTLAGALAASKLNIPIAHVEAGLRSFNKSMPEEQNRIVVDHLSSLMFCPTENARVNLINEGIDPETISVPGDVMYDALYNVDQSKYISSINLPGKYYLLTMHRAENTDNINRLRNIVDALNSIDHIKGVFPMHPRTANAMKAFGIEFDSEKINIIDPIGYKEMIFLESNSEFIVTDSGGVQKEAYFFRKPCITLRDETEWVETVTAGWNILTGANVGKIVNAVIKPPNPGKYSQLYGNGSAGKLIANQIVDYLSPVH